MRGKIILSIVAAALTTGVVLAGGEIHGTVVTTDGKRLTGPIHWDSNENFWSDRLDARKTEAIQPSDADEDEGFRFSLFGWEIINTKNDGLIYHQLSIPFGHLESIEPDGSNGAVLVLKDGSRVRAAASTTDLGRSLEITVDDPTQGSVELTWRRIARVEFSAGPGEGRDAERLYGTVTTRTGEITGFIVWDRDESLRDDLLDGEEGGDDHSIAFREIESIQPQGSSAALVKLNNGEKMKLRGTNDVNDDMRGLIVTVEGLGTVEVGWDDLRKVVFAEPPKSPRYEEFDGGKRLSGVVRVKDGRSLAGRITWDLDESYTWESLDGDGDHIGYKVAFRHIRSIEPSSDGSSEVTLKDGRKLRLTGSNDVDETNKGLIVVAEDGVETVLDWSAIEGVEFN